MKHLSIFLCLYMTILAVLPCRDQDALASATTLTSVISSEQSSHHQEQESCPPFCTCSCCSTVRTLNPLHIVIGTLERPVKKTYSLAAVPALSDLSRSIWQPPQLR